MYFKKRKMEGYLRRNLERVDDDPELFGLLELTYRLVCFVLFSGFLSRSTVPV